MRSLHRSTLLFALLVPFSLATRALAQEPPKSPPAADAAPEDEPVPEDVDEVTPEEAGESEAPAEEPAEPEAEAGEEDEIDDEALMEGDGEDPSRPPAAGKGAIWGVITDTEFNETLVEAPVQVIGTKFETLTDVEGRFRLELPPGTYSLRISYELHKTARIDGVVVAPGQVIRLDTRLEADETATDVFEVVEEADRTSLEGMILARQKSTVVGDSVGRAEISKSADRNAAQAAQRVVGATVVGGRFVYVRGLGERYTNALINGVPLPSPEPDRAAVPLDLFPTGVLNSLTIAKTFTPDVPGDFAGGSVRIETREIPSKPLLQLGASLGYNTNSTFRERLTHRGGDLDWLGIDDGTRAFPRDYPTYKVSLNNPKPDGTSQTAEDLVRPGRNINSYMSPTSGGTPPNHSLSVVGGNGWDFGNDRKLGAVGSLNYGRSFSVRRDEVIRDYGGSKEDPRGYKEDKDYRGTTGNDNVNWGGFGSLTYRFSAQHEIALLGLRSTLTDNRTQVVQGMNDDSDIWASRLSFVSRALNLALLSGDHRFPGLASAELDWNLTYSTATRDEPDRRDVVWTRGDSDVYTYADVPESGRHFFSDQIEKQYGAGLNWTQPVGGHDTKLKAGGLVSLRDRNFEARSMRFRRRAALDREDIVPSINCESRDFVACTDAAFVPENIGPILAITELGSGADAYDAFLNIYSGYVMADVGITKQVRAVIGERVEHTYQVIAPYDQFGLEEDGERASIRQTDLLPAVALIWSPTKKAKLRGSLTKTVARPQLLELAPFTYQDYFGGRMKGGYKDLRMTSIVNADLRIEYFPTLRDVFAFSLFYKDFTDPIEPVLLAQAMSFRNAKGANLLGVELEARRGLAEIAEALKDFSVVANLTLARSRVEVESGGVITLTNPSRQLVNQAPWVFNFALDYSVEKTGTTARLLYNIVGPRIVAVGSEGLPDVYEHPRNMLDVTVQQDILEALKLKLEARNLLNSEARSTMGCGGKGAFGSTWYLRCPAGDDRLVSRYREGATFTLSGNYEF